MPRLPRTTDAELLTAIPQMLSWTETSVENRWALREPGKQMLVYFGAGSNTELDLSKDSGSFLVNVVNPRTGQVTPKETVKAGDIVRLPNASVVWLVKEN